ncbi:MAG: hypothetical protein Q4C87_09205 [Actinomycetaceae bacterium]|nr:hypothetical protein [Actinomycetaceae bacterium]
MTHRPPASGDNEDIPELILHFEEDPATGTFSPAGTDSASNSSAAQGGYQQSAYSFDDQESGRRGQSPSSADSLSAHLGDPYSGGPFSAGATEGSTIDHRLATFALSSGILGVIVAVTALIGMVCARLPGSAVAAPWTLPISYEGGALATIATIIEVLFGPLGMLLIVLGGVYGLRRFLRRSAGTAFFVSMWLAGLVTWTVGLFTFGGHPFISLPIAGVSAAILTLLSLSIANERQGRIPVIITGVGVAIVALLSGILLAAGHATVIGIIGSIVISCAGALVGARLWNKIGAPLAAANQRAASFMEDVRAGRASRLY